MTKFIKTLAEILFIILAVAIFVVGFTRAEGKEVHTQLPVSCVVLPALAKPVVTQTIENGVTVITIKY